MLAVKAAFIGFALCAGCLPGLPCQASGNNGGEQSLACSYGYKKPMTSGEAKLDIKDHRINRIWFNSYYPGGQGELGFTCHIDLNRQDGAFTWQDKGLDITVTAKESGDTLQLNHDKKGYRLDFANFKKLSTYCGAGAEVPLDVFIPFSGRSCKIRLAQ